MTTEAVQCIAEMHPDLIYIEITAWATVALVIATIVMIVSQINAAKRENKIGLTMRLMDQYDSIQIRQNRKALATNYLRNDIKGFTAIETLLDVLETVAMLQRRKLVDDDLIENAFSVPIRYWWFVLEKDVAKMRSEFHDATIFEDCEHLAKKYDKSEREHRRVPAISDQDRRIFLESEVAQLHDDSAPYVVVPR